MISILVPLRKEVPVKFGEVDGKVRLRYEKLPEFCFKCGGLDHVESECKMTNITDVDPRPFSKWMRRPIFYPPGLLRAQVPNVNPIPFTPLTPIWNESKSPQVVAPSSKEVQEKDKGKQPMLQRGKKASPN